MQILRYWLGVLKEAVMRSAEAAGWDHPKRWPFSIAALALTTVIFYFASGSAEAIGSKLGWIVSALAAGGLIFFVLLGFFMFTLPARKQQEVESERDGLIEDRKPRLQFDNLRIDAEGILVDVVNSSESTINDCFVQLTDVTPTPKPHIHLPVSLKIWPRGELRQTLTPKEKTVVRVCFLNWPCEGVRVSGRLEPARIEFYGQPNCSIYEGKHEITLALRTPASLPVERKLLVEIAGEPRRFECNWGE